MLACPLSSVLRPLGYRDCKRTHPGDLAFELVAGHGCRHSGWRSGHDDVAGCELDHFAELRDHLRHVPDHLGKVAVLTHLPVSLERNPAFAGMADLASGLQRPAGRRGVEGLSDLPRPL